MPNQQLNAVSVCVGLGSMTHLAQSLDLPIFSYPTLLFSILVTEFSAPGSPPEIARQLLIDCGPYSSVYCS